MIARRPDPHQRLPILLNRLMELVHRRSAGDTLAVLSEAGLTMSQMVALHVLGRGGTTVGSLAEALRLSPASASHLVDRLLKTRLVTRREGAPDRRQKDVALTPRGRALMARVMEARASEFSAALATLDSRVVRKFEATLSRLVDALGEGQDRSPCKPIGEPTP